MRIGAADCTRSTLVGLDVWANGHSHSTLRDACLNLLFLQCFPLKFGEIMYLNCHSYYSLRYGTLSIPEWIELAQAHGIGRLALTDVHSTSACYDFVKACRAANIDPVVGMEFRRGEELLYIALARNLSGFAEINQFYSRFSHAKQPFPELPPVWSDVYVIYPWERQAHISLGEHEYLGVRPHQVPQLLRSRFRHRQDKLVVLQPVTYVDQRGFNLHRLLRAVDQNVLLSKLANGRDTGAGEGFVPPDALRQAYADYPQILQNTDRLLGDCSFDFDFNARRSRQTYTGGKYDDMVLLEKLAREGLAHRYGPHNREARERLDRELTIIDQLDFNAYFLITWDFVKYGRSRGFYHVGRGSGANSLAAYCLGITDVDPIELDLYFERFLNPKRTSPPDFDIDYSWRDRDEVLEYLLKRYRSSHTALLATYNCFRGRAAIRELGKVFGLPKREIDKIVGGYSSIVELDQLSQQVVKYAECIEGFPNHLGIHAGGVLISEDPMHAYTATDLPPKGMPITHFDMYVAEDINLHKFDVLSQRGLGHIKDSLKIIRDNQGKDVDIHDVQAFKQDKRVRQMLSDARTIGCFYIESPAMRQLLSKLDCDDYPTLVAASSIIRPGVASSGMMKAYIERHNGEPFQYLHPRLGELLDDTYGVMVYQEDVIKVVHGFAGLDLADADMLRRAMSGKFRSKDGFQQLERRFFASCAEQGHPEEVSREVWRQIQSFAGYSFSKAHSASFAVESFQSLYLKAYYPREFMVAVVNNFGGFYDTEFYLIEARMWGAKIHPPCVNHSEYYTRIIGEDIYLGFVHLKELGQKIAQNIAPERELRGDFQGMADFARRIPITREQLQILIRIGAFRFTDKTKAHLLWEMQLHVKRAGSASQADVLFLPEGQEFELPDFEQSPLEDAYDEMELLGFSICPPFALVPQIPEASLLVRDLPNHLGHSVEIAGYLINIKPVKTKYGERMQFAHFIDAECRPFDVTVFPDQVRDYPFSGRGVYWVKGLVVEEFGSYSLEVQEMRKFVFQPDPRMEGTPALPDYKSKKL
ncbi:DNA polymerase III subunit alpha [Pontibacter sp. G13]|uniref:DNA polymerase III subunit alpha n=1 Tax=Pontibacter sp. G13 TaxID=3074898 RepID=UPI00288952AB|nr:DNA polymerase III subunit alpha [Pontibacter sp. G13]WNJ19863.1 DNA polymerase III subunit alpha [Pontibacter sp. G13]